MCRAPSNHAWRWSTSPTTRSSCTTLFTTTSCRSLGLNWPLKTACCCCINSSCCWARRSMSKSAAQCEYVQQHRLIALCQPHLVLAEDAQRDGQDTRRCNQVGQRSHDEFERRRQVRPNQSFVLRRTRVLIDLADKHKRATCHSTRTLWAFDVCCCSWRKRAVAWALRPKSSQTTSTRLLALKCGLNSVLL